MVIITGLSCYILAIVVNLLGDTVIKLAFANFGVCGGAFLGLIIAGFTKEMIGFNSVSVCIGTGLSLIICAVGGFGGVIGLNIPGITISPLWWTPIGCSIMLCLSLLIKIFTKSNNDLELNGESQSMIDGVIISQNIPHKPN